MSGLTWKEQMIRWMCGISLKDRMTNEELRRLVGVEPITPFSRSGRLRWYGHVMRKGDEDWVKKCMEYRVEGRRLVGRPRKSLLESVEADMAELEIDIEVNGEQSYEEEVQPYRKLDYKPILYSIWQLNERLIWDTLYIVGRIVNLRINDNVYSITSSKKYFTLKYTSFGCIMRPCIQLVAYTNANQGGDNIFHQVTSMEVTEVIT